MKSTTKGSYLKDSKTFINVSSATTNGTLKQVTNLIEDNDKLKYSIDNGATYKSPTETIETQVANIISGTTPVAEATHAITAGSATNATNADNAIKNSDNTYSGLAQNANNVLKVGSEIVEKKVVLFSGDEQPIGGAVLPLSNQMSLASYNLSAGDTLELTIKWRNFNGTMNPYGTQKIRIIYPSNYDDISLSCVQLWSPYATEIRTNQLSIVGAYNGGEYSHLLYFNYWVDSVKIKSDGSVEYHRYSGADNIGYTPHILEIAKIIG